MKEFEFDRNRTRKFQFAGMFGQNANPDRRTAFAWGYELRGAGSI
jgi:hypothetical protein